MAWEVDWSRPPGDQIVERPDRDPTPQQPAITGGQLFDRATDPAQVAAILAAELTDLAMTVDHARRRLRQVVADAYVALGSLGSEDL